MLKSVTRLSPTPALRFAYRGYASLPKADFLYTLDHHPHLFSSAGTGTEQRETCEKIFDLSQRSPLPFGVLGPSRSLWVPTILRNFGMVSTHIIKPKTFNFALKNPRWANPGQLDKDEERRALSELIDEQERKEENSGAVLFEILKWSLAANDAFILGMASSNKEIHIAHENIEFGNFNDDLLYDSHDNRPTVLARELGILARLGYKRIKSSYKFGGIVLMPEEGFEDVNSDEYRDVLERIRLIKSASDVKEVLMKDIGYL